MAKLVRQVRPALLRELNERAIFELIRNGDPISRAELTRRMNISAPAVSRAVANLLRAGLLEETDAKVGGAGRPGKLYRVARGHQRVLGATIGLRHCAVLSAGLDGEFADGEVLEFPTPSSYPRLITELAARARQLGRRHDRPPLGLGISVPGQIDRRSQRVLSSPNLHLLDGKSPSEDLRRRLRIETAMFHDSDCASLAERAFGQARGMNDFALISVYEGFSVSIVSDGRIIHGHDGLAGEVGHCTVDVGGRPCGCGNRGCLETVATDQAFARAIGDPAAVDRAVEYLAVGIGMVINTFNPQAILLCSRTPELYPPLLDELRARLKRHSLPALSRCCQLLRAEGSTRKGAIASIIHHITRSLGPAIV